MMIIIIKPQQTARSELASASEPSGLLPLNFLIVISDMHKNLERTQDRSDLSTVLTENIFFLLEKVYIVNHLDMASNLQV